MWKRQLGLAGFFAFRFLVLEWAAGGFTVGPECSGLPGAAKD